MGSRYYFQQEISSYTDHYFVLCHSAVSLATNNETLAAKQRAQTHLFHLQHLIYSSEHNSVFPTKEKVLKRDGSHLLRRRKRRGSRPTLAAANPQEQVVPLKAQVSSRAIDFTVTNPCLKRQQVKEESSRGKHDLRTMGYLKTPLNPPKDFLKSRERTGTPKQKAQTFKYSVSFDKLI